MYLEIHKNRKESYGMKKAIALFVALIMSAMVFVACGKEDPLNRTEGYIEVVRTDGTTEVYGLNEGEYEGFYYATTEKQANAQNKELVENLKNFILAKLPDEEIGELFYYVETVEGEGYLVDVFYQSLSKDSLAMSKVDGCLYHKCFNFQIEASEEENQEIYTILKNM